jgi:hypothetical protein
MGCGSVSRQRRRRRGVGTSAGMAVASVGREGTATLMGAGCCRNDLGTPRRPIGARSSSRSSGSRLAHHPSGVDR